MTDVYFAKTDILCDKNEYLKRYNLLPQNRKEKTDRLFHDEDKRLSVGAWCLLCYAMGEKGIKNDEIILLKNEHGKPFLSQYPNIFFNLSHSGNCVMCAVSDSEVGCDTEKLRPVNLKIADRFFHENEIRQLESLNEKDRETLFFRLWTLKESFLKATGKGFSLPLKDFCIDLTKENVEITQNVFPDKKYFFKEYQSDDFRLAVCAESDGFSELIEVNI